MLNEQSASVRLTIFSINNLAPNALGKADPTAYRTQVSAGNGPQFIARYFKEFTRTFTQAVSLSVISTLNQDDQFRSMCKRDVHESQPASASRLGVG